MMSTINDNSRQNITFISIFPITLYELKQANFVKQMDKKTVVNYNDENIFSY